MCETKDYRDYCASGDPHIMSEVKEEWVGDRWRIYKECIRCGYSHGVHIVNGFCDKNKDRLHRFVRSSSVGEDLGLIDEVKCNDCTLHISMPISHPNYEKFCIRISNNIVVK